MHNAPRRPLAIANLISRRQRRLGLSEGEMLERIVASTTTNSRQFNYLVPDNVTDAIAGCIDCSAPGRIISTFAAVQSVRDKVPDCEMSDDQIERCAVLAAVDAGLAVHFDRRGRQPDPYSSLSRSHWHLVPIWKTKATTRLAHVSFRRPNDFGPAGRTPPFVVVVRPQVRPQCVEFNPTEALAGRVLRNP